MTTSEFKRVGRLLKELYAELEKEAIEEGVDIFSEEFIQVRDALRTEVLTRLGFTVEEYREAKELVAPAKKVDVAKQLEELSGKTSELESNVQNLQIPDEEELVQKMHEFAESVVKPPVIQNNIVERTTIEKPTIVEKTIIETEEYDDAPIYAELGYLHDKLESIKMPEIPNVDEKIEAVKAELKSDFMRELEHNINTLGMPDFRKLAMGLQAQIDEVRNTTSSGAIILQSPDGTRWQIGITNAGELTATSL